MILEVIIETIFTIFLWQVLTTIVYIASKKDRRKALAFSVCLVTGIAWLLYWVVEGIKKIVNWFRWKFGYGYYD